jgi:SOS response regulatory protein OraA/RecX
LRRSNSKRRFPSRAESTPGGAGDAVEAALRSLRQRDRSASQIDDQLAARGVSEDERVGALATLMRTGLVDDRRFAEARAERLAERGGGDALIRHDLVRAGVDADLVEHALTALESERERAERIVARRGSGPKTARYLSGKGFSEEVVHAVVARSVDDALG